MKALCTTILSLLIVLLLGSCSKTFSCSCYLYDKQAGLENGSRVIRMDIKALNARSRAEKNCEQHEVELTSDAQAANCNLQ